MSANLTSILVKAVREVLSKFPALEEKFAGSETSDAIQLIEDVTGHDVALELILAEAAILAAKEARGESERRNRSSITFRVNSRSEQDLIYTNSSEVTWSLGPTNVKECIQAANETIELFHDLSTLYGIELFQLLGLRNLSSFVGEVFAKQLRLSDPERFMSNPNQDGYPDLCALTPEGLKYIERSRREDGTLRRDKELWSPYPHGGIEVKATCGNTPPASRVPKPGIGEARLPILESAEWKAHHQQTKTLLGIYWDFVDGLPTVIAAFFRNDLDTTIGRDNADWGAVITPKEEGGRTTSVSIMKRGGVKKMGRGWIVLPTADYFYRPLSRIFLS
jgi:hypothetical protein